MKARKVRGLRPEEPLRPNAERILATRLEELREISEEALEPGAEEAQHDLRIAAKRLRYVLDVVGVCFGPVGEESRLLAKQLQTVLGEIHDCDVMAPRVEGIASLEALLRTRRELLFLRFRELWGADATRAAMEAIGEG